MNCSRCGAQLNQGDAFCTSCGQPVAQPVAQPQVAPTADVNQFAQPVVQPVVQPVNPVFGAATVTPQPMQPAVPMFTQQPMAQVPVATQKSKKKMILIIGLIVAALVVVLGIVFGFVAYYNSPSVRFARESEVLNGSNYTIKAPKGWSTDVVNPFVAIFNSSKQSEGLLTKGSISYSDAKSQVDQSVTNLESGGFTFSSKKESTQDGNQMYVAEATGDISGKNTMLLSVLTHDNKTDKSGWMIFTTDDKKLKTDMSDFAVYIITSLELKSSTDSSRSLKASSTDPLVKSLGTDVSF